MSMFNHTPSSLSSSSRPFSLVPSEEQHSEPSLGALLDVPVFRSFSHGETESKSFSGASIGGYGGSPFTSSLDGGEGDLAAHAYRSSPYSSPFTSFSSSLSTSDDRSVSSLFDESSLSLSGLSMGEPKLSSPTSLWSTGSSKALSFPTTAPAPVAVLATAAFDIEAELFGSSSSSPRGVAVADGRPRMCPVYVEPHTSYSCQSLYALHSLNEWMTRSFAAVAGPASGHTHTPGQIVIDSTFNPHTFKLVGIARGYSGSFSFEVNQYEVAAAADAFIAHAPMSKAFDGGYSMASAAWATPVAEATYVLEFTRKDGDAPAFYRLCRRAARELASVFVPLNAVVATGGRSAADDEETGEGEVELEAATLRSLYAMAQSTDVCIQRHGARALASLSHSSVNQQMIISEAPAAAPRAAASGSSASASASSSTFTGPPAAGASDPAAIVAFLCALLCSVDAEVSHCGALLIANLCQQAALRSTACALLLTPIAQLLARKGRPDVAEGSASPVTERVDDSLMCIDVERQCARSLATLAESHAKVMRTQAGDSLVAALRAHRSACPATTSFLNSTITRIAVA